MLKISPEQAKQKLKLQLLNITHKLDDEELLECLSHVEFGEDDSDCIYVYDAIYHAVDQLFTFEYTDPKPLSEEMEDDTENQVEYSRLATFHIPGIIPYLESPAFDEFMEHDSIQFAELGSFNDALELYYLPKSAYAYSTEEYEVDFADQPGTFCIGIFDQGGCDTGQLIKFLKKMREFNTYINQLIA